MESPFDSKHAQILQRIFYYADAYGIDRNFAVWQIWQESRFNPRASSGQANGLCQFTPATAARFGVDVWDVESSLNGWGKYMSWLLKRYNGVYWLALAGYHSGEGNADKFKKLGYIPSGHPNAQNYIKIISENVKNNGGSIPSNSEIPTTTILIGALILALLW